MKRTLTLILALLLTLTVLSGCGGATPSASAAAGEAAADYGYTESADLNGAKYGAWPADAPAASADSPAEAQESGGSRVDNAKLIYTASMNAETTDFDGCAADLEKLVAQMDGYFENTSVSNYGSGYRSGSYTVRIPAAQFQAFCKQVGSLCHVTYRDSSAENVSEAYYDTQSRLETQRTKLERLQTLLKQADKMEDIITIESAISDTELTIEQLSGTLRTYDALVDYATVYVNLEEVYKLSNTEEPSAGFASRVGTAFSSGWKNFVAAMESFAVALAYGWVWLVLLAAIAAAFVALSRRSRARKLAKKAAQPAPAPKKPEDKPE